MMAYVYHQYYTNKYNENNQFFNLIIKNEGSSLLAQNEVRADIFQVLWQFFNPKGSLLRAGGRGSGGNSARPTNFGRNQFEFFRKHTAS